MRRERERKGATEVREGKTSIMLWWNAHLGEHNGGIFVKLHHAVSQQLPSGLYHENERERGDRERGREESERARVPVREVGCRA